MRRLTTVLLLSWCALCMANPAVEALLAAADAPDGVVFEVIEGDEEALRGILPRIVRLSQQLRARFPGLPIAVVTHGREQFGLLRQTADGDLADIHALARSLGDRHIDLHVCAVHAGWEGYAVEDFPAYVDVSASGPAQINDYRNLGYRLIRIDADLP